MPMTDIGIGADVVTARPAVIGVGDIIIVGIKLAEKPAFKQTLSHGVVDKYQTHRRSRRIGIEGLGQACRRAPACSAEITAAMRVMTKVRSMTCSSDFLTLMIHSVDIPTPAYFTPEAAEIIYKSPLSPPLAADIP